MNKVKLKEYAALLANIGLRVEKGEEVWIMAGLDQPEFVLMVVEQCYKAGASFVKVDWSNEAKTKLDFKYAKVGTLSKVPSYEVARWKYRVKKLPSFLYIDSDDPDSMKGINPNKLAKVQMKRFPKIKPFRDAIESKYKWCIASVPGKAWAKKMFPNCSIEEAEEKLWDAIFTCTRVDEEGSVENWNKHNEYLISQKNKLDNLKLKYLEYKSSNGTNFKVELNKGVYWGAGVEETSNKKCFNPNMPTEEVFTSPVAGKCEGLLVATKPLSYNGNLIEDFSVKFVDGKAVEVKAKKGQQVLEHMIKMDEGACKLGEVALVPYTSPINQSGLLFYNTLFDENACCHVALGFGFKELLPNGSQISTEEATNLGINYSMIHVDFMIGSPDLDIVGIDENGKRTQIFKNGVWAI